VLQTGNTSSNNTPRKKIGKKLTPLLLSFIIMSKLFMTSESSRIQAVAPGWVPGTPVVLFYGSDAKKAGEKAVLSNFFRCTFVHPTTNMTFTSSEQYMVGLTRTDDK
jgi:hypothetical protein